MHTRSACIKILLDCLTGTLWQHTFHCDHKGMPGRTRWADLQQLFHHSLMTGAGRLPLELRVQAVCQQIEALLSAS